VLGDILILPLRFMVIVQDCWEEVAEEEITIRPWTETAYLL
jgi:hypothetical protein